MSYESPIVLFSSEIDKINSLIIEKQENAIVTKISQTIGVDISKDELIRALNYDRNQYEAGYKDGRNQDIWISVDDEFPPAGELVLCCGEKGGMFLGKYAGNSSLDDKPVAYTQSRTSRVLKFWRPLPKPPEV